MAGEDVMDLIPVGLHVLVVDDNPTCLKILQRLLWLCQYIVTITTEARLALEILRADKDKYDIVITDVHMPEMNGLVLLEHIGLELDIPVIMLSANDDPRLVMKGVKHGAVDYMLKPVRLEDLKHIWQHVVRRKQLNKRKGKEPMIDEDDAEVDPAFLEEADSVIPDEASTKKRKDKEVREDDDDDGQGSEEERGSESTDVASQKKPRIVWSPELHQKFVDAVDQLGADRAFPKKILDVMNVEGLTRENVASHLQKYRLYLRRMSTSGQFGDPVLPFGLLGGGSMYNPFTRMLGHLNPAAGYHGVLSQRASNLVTGLAQSYNVGRFQNPIAPLGMSPFSLQSREGLGNQAPVVVAPSDVRPQGIAPQLQDYGRPQGIAPQLQDYVRPQGIAPQLQDYVRPQAIAPQLQDYTQRLEHWQSEITARVPAQQNQATNNQISPSSYNGADLSYLQSALARHSLDPPPATHGGPNAGVIGGQVPQLGAQNVSYNVNMEPPRWQEPPIVSPNITSVFNSEPLAPAIASSSRVFGADSPSPFINNLLDMQGSEVDVFENYLLDDPDLDFDFDQNNGGSLEDIVKGFPK